MKKLVWLPVAGFLLIAGAAVAAAAPTVLQQAAAVLAADASPSPDTITTQVDQEEEGRPDFAGRPEWAGKFRGHAVLTEVLADLVVDGTISQAQSDAIVDALEAKVEDLRTEAQARGQQMREVARMIRTFLEDGVITQDEIDQLPADSPLREIWDSIAENGQVTLEQLRELRPHGGPGIGRGWGHGRFRQGPPDWAPSFDDGSDEESDD